MTALGSADAAPGELATGRLEVGETRDGSAAGLPVAVLNGASAGNTLYIQAASDGDELNGVGVLTQLVPRLDPAEVAGTLLIVGIANRPGFLVSEHRNPLDDTKLNRAYPGDPAGSSSERIAHATFQAATRADLALDLHQGSTSQMIEEVRVRCGRHHRNHTECLDLARAFGAGHILDQKGPEGQLARVAPEEGIPTVDPELGGAVGWDQQSIQIGVEGVFNVLRQYEFLPETVEQQTQTRATEFDRYCAPAGGLVRQQIELGERVDRGTELFDVMDVFGTTQATVTADSRGIFWRARRLPQVGTGEYVCSVGTNVDTC